MFKIEKKVGALKAFVDLQGNLKMIYSLNPQRIAGHQKTTRKTKGNQSPNPPRVAARTTKNTRKKHSRLVFLFLKEGTGGGGT